MAGVLTKYLIRKHEKDSNMVENYYHWLCLSSEVIKTSTFRKLVILSSSGEQDMKQNPLRWDFRYSYSQIREKKGFLLYVVGLKQEWEPISET
jgi:tRNA(His) 5'-end guanylyltransferase